MESGPPGPDRPSDEEHPGAEPPPREGPQAPTPGHQAPPPGTPPGFPPQAPAPPGGGFPTGAPQAPPGYGQPQAPAYRGPVPPGGWQPPPLTQSGSGWVGLPLASWGSRVGAAVLDGLILTVPVVILVGIVVGIFAAGSDIGGVVVAIIAVLAYGIAALFYAPVLMAREGAHNGQTWGKQIVGITVVRDEGQTVSMSFAFLREFVVKNLLFGWVGSFLLYIPTLLDYLWPLWDDENRCLHDMIVSTHVVRR